MVRLRRIMSGLATPTFRPSSRTVIASSRRNWIGCRRLQVIDSMKPLIHCNVRLLQPVWNYTYSSRNMNSLSYSGTRIKHRAATCLTVLIGKLPACNFSQYEVQCGACTIAMSRESELNGSAPNSGDIFRHDSLKLDDEVLCKAIAYEAEHGFSNKMGRTTRFGEFLCMKLSSLLASTQGDNMLQILADHAQSYERMNDIDRINLLDKVSKILGFCSVKDLAEHQAALREASRNLHDNSKEINVLPSSTIPEHSKGKTRKVQSATSPFVQQHVHPSVVFGSSERIELFDFPDRGTEMLEISSARESKGTPSTKAEHTIIASKVSSTQAPILCEKGGFMEEKNSKRQVQVKRTSRRIGVVSCQVGLAGATNRQHVQTKGEGKSSNDQVLSDSYDSWLLNKPIESVKNLSSHQRSQLDEHGLHTVRKLLQHFPRTYVNFHPAGEIVEDGQYLTFFGKIISSQGFQRAGNFGIIEIVVKSIAEHNYGSLEMDAVEEKQRHESSKQGVFLHLKKFFRGARFCSSWFLNKMVEKYPAGALAAVSGKVKVMEQKNHFEIRDFNVELCESKDWMDPEVPKDRPYPVYPSKAGLTPKFIELCLQKVIGDLPLGIDPIPKNIRTKFELMELSEAFVGIHTPPDLEVAEKARQRFVFDDFFYLQLGLLMQRQIVTDKYVEVAGSTTQEEAGSLDMEKWSPLTLKLVRALPFRLTNSQIKAASDIMWDLQRPIPMSRLLQGDVGCGKTIVAFLALLEVIDAGYQGALMAPTEFLVNQHYERIVSLLENLEEKDRPRVALLTSSVIGGKARAIRKDLESGEIALAVGTHSLIANSVKFAALGLAVIDEQHRFGVNQRVRLNNKGMVMNAAASTNQSEDADSNVCEDKSTRMPNLRALHVLAMSATPIPRTLALTLHGDMAFSQITELPPGRTPTKTYAFRNNKAGISRTHQMVRKDLKSGGRVFIVYPIIDESDEMPSLKAATVEYENLVKEFKDYSCGLVHGRLKTHEKEETMRCFRSGDIQVLVSTTVIELGVDIPEASMIVIANAERYGMAQLHQLRGRVGRGTRESTCVLLATSDTSLERLKLLEESTDGFYLAEMDLRLRGPGDLLGKQQSGYIPEFIIARLEDDGEIMNQARIAAEEVLRDHHALEGLPHLKQELSFRRPPAALGIS